MSRPQNKRRPSVPLPGILMKGRTQLASIPEHASALTRRPSVSGSHPLTGGPKAQRSTKTSQRHVLLPSEPQTKPLPAELRAVEEDEEAFVTVKGTRAVKTTGERMTKVERSRSGYQRLTAYCVAESLRTKLLAAFLKREHNVTPRIFDEAMYAMYHLPLLPGYGTRVHVRSSTGTRSPGGTSITSRLSEAEEMGYQGMYFNSENIIDEFSLDGFIPSSSPETSKVPLPTKPIRQTKIQPKEQVAEVVFFAYGVIVFFGLTEEQEHLVIDDLECAGILIRHFERDAWEIEECHYEHDPNAAYPRIYNDLFTFKSESHLLKLSIAHALAQSTLLACYETKAQSVFSDPHTIAIPRQLASTGELKLRRGEALRFTGRLFQLRRDINLVSNVLDVPELFWSEASLKELYDAVREYMEISPRVQVLNERLTVASDLLDLIHSHLNNSAMERITWIIIWLIVVACVVELGEVIARLVVHATMSGNDAQITAANYPRLPRGLVYRAYNISKVIVKRLT